MDKPGIIQLGPMYRGLAQVRRHRAGVRLGAAAALTASVFVWLMLAAFALDVTLHMRLLERIVTLCVVLAGGAWGVWRFLRPVFGIREDDIELAMLVEQKQGLASDLVAAIQFSDESRRQFGSHDLRQSVVDCTAEASESLNFLEGFDRGPMRRSGTILLATMLAFLIPAILYPNHMSAFLKRMAMMDAKYPTRTIIRKVLSPGGKAGYGRSVEFSALVDVASGDLPEGGQVELTAVKSGAKAVIDMRPSQADRHLYSGVLDRALDEMEYVLKIGDDTTDPMILKLIPPPVVSLDMQISPPEYAAAKNPSQVKGLRAVAVEGSGVSLRLTGDKELRSATLTADNNNYPLLRSGGNWQCDPQNSPLNSISRSVQFEIQVVDVDGLNLPAPICGSVEVRSDQPPRIGAACVTQMVLPTAAPKIRYQAQDDFAIGRITANIEVVKADGTRKKSGQDVIKPGKHPAELAGWFDLPLQPLELEKGDKVEIKFEVADYRGTASAQTAGSEVVILQVTDLTGILASITQSDQELAGKLDKIIKTQLGTGD
ncbi:MAG: hypothetical protein HZA50_12000 [Planctomycetes bacterium]|nr:hypothetical protein [Planctomycetota bacterium]